MKLRYWSLLILFAASAAFAAEKKAPPAYTTPEQGGRDFQIQGEYECTINGGKAGAQVLALGDDKFHVVGFYGGLPGDGWDGSPKIELDGAMQDGKVVFTRGSESLTIADGKATLKLQDGSTAEMKRIVRKSPTEGLKAPEGAIVLFDGSNLDAFRPGAKMDDRKLLMSQSNPITRQEFKDFTLHIEFILPFMPEARGQGRANSGVYLQGRYEIQVLDSFGLKGADNECGGIYQNAAPSINMCYPPLQWQTYDVDFTAAKYDGDKKIANSVVTIKHNGVVIHDKLELKGPTPGGPKSDAKRYPESQPGPFYLQAHGNPVFYRNMWVVEKK